MADYPKSLEKEADDKQQWQLVRAADNGFSLAKLLQEGAGKAFIPGLVLGATSLGVLYDKLKGDNRRKAIFESLCWDPMFKDMDKSQLLQWYTTIYHYAPRTSLDKVATKELLRQFMTFGRVDLQTLKTLAETEKAMAEAENKSPSLAALWK